MRLLVDGKWLGYHISNKGYPRFSCTGPLRGNAVIGHAFDSIENLMAAARYLRRSK